MVGIGNEQWEKSTPERLNRLMLASQSSSGNQDCVVHRNSEGKTLITHGLFVLPESRFADQRFCRGPESWFLAQGARYDNYGS